MLVFLLSVAGAATPLTGTEGSEPIWHSAAQRCFPATIGDWALLTARSYQNVAGEDRSVAYGRGNALASVYVYPQYHTVLNGVAAARYEQDQVANEAGSVRWRHHARVRVPDSIGRGFVVVGDLAATGSASAQQTLAAVWAADPWFVKLRLTWDDPRTPWRSMLNEPMARTARLCTAPTGPPPELRFKTEITLVPGGGPMTTKRIVYRVDPAE